MHNVQGKEHTGADTGMGMGMGTGMGVARYLDLGL